MFFFLKKKYCSADSDDKIVCSANWKNNKFVHKAGKKLGLYRGKNLFVHLPGRKKRLFLVRRKKKVCTGKNAIAPPPPIIWSTCQQVGELILYLLHLFEFEFLAKTSCWLVMLLKCCHPGHQTYSLPIKSLNTCPLISLIGMAERAEGALHPPVPP